MARIQLPSDLPYEVGALYNRRQDIHGVLGGQMQGGISTPATSPYVILFTGEAGVEHGYHDHWEEEGGENILHYYGEGQEGDMQDTHLINASMRCMMAFETAAAENNRETWEKRMKEKGCG